MATLMLLHYLCQQRIQVFLLGGGGEGCSGGSRIWEKGGGPGIQIPENIPEKTPEKKEIGPKN